MLAYYHYSIAVYSCIPMIKNDAYKIKEFSTETNEQSCLILFNNSDASNYRRKLHTDTQHYYHP